MTWLIVLAAIATFAYAIWIWRRRWRDQQRASEERMAAFMAQTKPAPAPSVGSAAPAKVDSTIAVQKLLFDAAAKAAEAGEPALSIQLYARLLSRFPDCAFAGQVRAAVEAQKLKLAKP